MFSVLQRQKTTDGAGPGQGISAGPRVLALGTTSQGCTIPKCSLLTHSWEHPSAFYQYGDILTVPPAAE